MTVRPLALAALLAFALPTASYAATRPAPRPAKVCLQLTDPDGDAYYGGNNVNNPAGQPATPALDIRSGDIATGAHNLVVVLRLKTLAADPMTTGGTAYEFKWTAGGVAQSVVYRTYAGGEHEFTYNPGTGTATEDDIAVAGFADPSTATITWTVPRTKVAALKKPGTTFSAIGATAGVGRNVMLAGGLNPVRGSTLADDASTGKTYADLAPTCLKGT
jgi:hypothetical protein